MRSRRKQIDGKLSSDCTPADGVWHVFDLAPIDKHLLTLCISPFIYLKGDAYTVSHLALLY